MSATTPSKSHTTAHAVALATGLAVLAGLLRHGHVDLRWGWVCLAVLAALVTVGPTATVSVGAFLFALGAAPQTARVFRSSDTSGVSATTWAVATVTATLWLVFGLAVGRWQVWAPVTVTLACAVTISWRLHHQRHHRKAR